MGYDHFVFEVLFYYCEVPHPDQGPFKAGSYNDVTDFRRFSELGKGYNIFLAGKGFESPPGHADVPGLNGRNDIPKRYLEPVHSARDYLYFYFLRAVPIAVEV